MIDIKKLGDFFDSEEGNRYITDYVNKLDQRTKIKNIQLERVKRYDFGKITEKVISKYSSDQYKKRWYDRSIEPPQSMFWFLFEYAQKYGRECDEQEYEKYGNMFTASMFFVNGYYFNEMNGQGSVIKISKAV